MANIDIRRFVDINIVHHKISTVKSIRDTVVLFTSEGSDKQPIVVSSLDEFNAYDNKSTMTTTKVYVTQFFNCNGNKIYIVPNKVTVTLDDIKALKDEYIVIAFAGSSYYQSALTLIDSYNADNTIYGIKSKIFLLRLSSKDVAVQVRDSLAMKYSPENDGVEMSIAAYLSNINVYGSNTVQDYSFTQENVTAEENNDDTLKFVMDNNINVDMTIANTVRNLGGNMVNGNDLVNEFTLIVLQQTLTERVLNLLVEKIKGNKGLAAIKTTMSQELGKYLINGYLTTDKIWTDETLYVTDSHGVTHTIIEKNTPLTLGYYITILPLSSLSDTDKKNRQTPAIYLIVADSYGIRKVTISGEVI